MNNSYWDNIKINIKNNDHVDKTNILIIGAGITGIMCAYELSKNNKDIILVDRGKVASKVTLKTTAMITSMHNLGYQKIKKCYGMTKAREYYDSQEEAIKSVLNNIKNEKIDCDLKKEIFYNYATTNKGKNKLIKEFDTLKELKVDVKWVSKIPLDIKVKKAFRYDNNYTFHPLKYLAKIVEIIQMRRVKIFENYNAVKYDYQNKLYTVYFDNGKKITANIVIVATNYPIFNNKGLYFTKLYQEKDYAIAFKTKKKIDGIYMNTDEPSRSFRSHLGVGIISGSSHDAGKKVNYVKVYNDLKNSLKKFDSKSEIISEWTNQDVLSVDYLPYIGEYSPTTPKMYVATAFQAWGMSNSHVASLLLGDLINNNKINYAYTYEPNRHAHLRSPIQSLMLISKSINGLLLSRLLLAKRNLENVKSHTGQIIKYNSKHYAVYNTGEEYIILKPNCPHTYCFLHFNELEMTWDCKCHGSRFDIYGKVLLGPATKPLERVYFN